MKKIIFLLSLVFVMSTFAKGPADLMCNAYESKMKDEVAARIIKMYTNYAISDELKTANIYEKNIVFTTTEDSWSKKNYIKFELKTLINDVPMSIIGNSVFHYKNKLIFDGIGNIIGAKCKMVVDSFETEIKNIKLDRIILTARLGFDGDYTVDIKRINKKNVDRFWLGKGDNALVFSQYVMYLNEEEVNAQIK